MYRIFTEKSLVHSILRVFISASHCWLGGRLWTNNRSHTKQKTLNHVVITWSSGVHISWECNIEIASSRPQKSKMSEFPFRSCVMIIVFLAATFSVW